MCCLPFPSSFYVLVFNYDFLLFGASKILLKNCSQYFNSFIFKTFDFLDFIITHFAAEPSDSKIKCMDFTIDFIKFDCCQIYFKNYFSFN